MTQPLYSKINTATYIGISHVLPSSTVICAYEDSYPYIADVYDDITHKRNSVLDFLDCCQDKITSVVYDNYLRCVWVHLDVPHNLTNELLGKV